MRCMAALCLHAMQCLATPLFSPLIWALLLSSCPLGFIYYPLLFISNQCTMISAMTTANRGPQAFDTCLCRRAFSSTRPLLSSFRAN